MREIIDMASRTAFKESRCTEEAVKLAKAYADAQVEAKDKAIEGLVAQNLETFNKLQQQEAENHLKDAEIKRLREGIHAQWDFIGKMPASSVSEDFKRVYNALGVLCFDYNLTNSPLNEDQE